MVGFFVVACFLELFSSYININLDVLVVSIARFPQVLLLSLAPTALSNVPAFRCTNLN